MPIEIIPKKKEKRFKFSLFNVLFGISIILIVSAVAGYFVMGYFYQIADQEMQGILNQISEKETPEAKKLEELMKSYEQKINTVSPLLDAHSYSANFFPLLEGLTHPKVSFSQLTFNMKDYRASLSGETESFQTLGQQMDILEEKKDKENLFTAVNLSSFSIEKEGDISFKLDLTFNPAVFK